MNKFGYYFNGAEGYIRLFDTKEKTSSVGVCVGNNTLYAGIVASNASNASKLKFQMDGATYAFMSDKLANSVSLSSNNDSILASHAQNITVTRNGSGTLSLVNNNPSIATGSISGTTLTVTAQAKGNASITVNVAEDIDYNSVSTTYNCSVYKLNNTITLSSNSDAVTVGRTKEITVTRNGNGTISILNNNPSVIGATLSGNKITVEGLTNGNASITVNVAEGTEYNAASTTYNCSVTTIPESLNDASWDLISDLIKSGQFGTYYKVGDTKDITLDLPAGSYNLEAGKYFSNAVSGTYKVVVLGIDHNSTYEGTNRVHFCIGQNSTGKDIAFMDMKTNTTNTNLGGWAGCQMRTWLNETLINGLPSDLTSVITPCTKYTNNKGYSDAEADVTATSDKLWLLSEFEVFGTRENANQYEQNKQAQYDYYKNGASKVRYEHQSPNRCMWRLRSAHYGNSSYFGMIREYGANYYDIANYQFGVVPCFTIS